MKKPSSHTAIRQRRRDAAKRSSDVRKSLFRWLVSAALRWLRRRPTEAAPAAPKPVERSNPMRLPSRKAAFDKSLAGLRDLFPDASEDFVRDQARRTARAVPVPKRARAACRKHSVAVTYRRPTRAERQEQHRNKMLWKSQRRAHQ